MALSAVVQEAYIHRVSTRKVADLVKALGMSGIFKNRVSELCEQLDEEVERFRNRALEGPHPYGWLDATYLKIQLGRASILHVRRDRHGSEGICRRKRGLGLDVGPSESSVFWSAFLHSLVARGLCGVWLAISDAHRGLKNAAEAILQGASWQRCRVHFMRTTPSL